MPRLTTSVLIVDDEPATRMAMTHMFASLGHNVRSAEDGFSALSAIRQELPEVVLSDLNMPGMSGFELLSIVRRRFPRIKVIAMSGAFSGDGAQPGVAADAFYEKGNHLSNLLSTLEVLVHKMPADCRSNERMPIWVAGNGAASSFGAELILSCSECLRSFLQTHDDNLPVIREITCPHCFSIIRYAVVQPSNASAPQLFQLKQTPALAGSDCLPPSQADRVGKLPFVVA